MLADFQGASEIRDIVASGGQVYCVVDYFIRHGSLYRIGAGRLVPDLVFDLPNQPIPRGGIFPFQDRAIAVVRDSAGTHVVLVDGVQTTNLLDGNFVSLNQGNVTTVSVNGVSILDSTNWQAYWTVPARCDGTLAGTRMLPARSVDTSPNFIAPGLISDGHVAMFLSGAEFGLPGHWSLCRLQGAAEQFDIVDAWTTDGPKSLIGATAGRFYYERTRGSSSELWVTSGEPGSGRRIIGLSELDPAVRYVGYGTGIGDSFCFLACTGIFSGRMFATDGTPSGTRLLVPPGVTTSLRRKQLLAVNSRIGVFNASSTESGAELWVTDGTPDGTSLLLDLEPGPGSSDPTPLVVTGGRAIFVARTSRSGGELYITDGTREGTRALGEIEPGPNASLGYTDLHPIAMAEFGHLLVIPHGTSTGAQLWVVSICLADFNSDGDINPDDLGDFISAFLEPDPSLALDIVGDGEINIDDFVAFVLAYFEGCS